MSATSSDDVERLQKLVLHNPITLNLAAAGAGAAGTGAGAEEGVEGGGAAERDGGSLASGSGISADIQHFYMEVRRRGGGGPCVCGWAGARGGSCGCVCVGWGTGGEGSHSLRHVAAVAHGRTTMYVNVRKDRPG